MCRNGIFRWADVDHAASAASSCSGCLIGVAGAKLGTPSCLPMQILRRSGSATPSPRTTRTGALDAPSSLRRLFQQALMKTIGERLKQPFCGRFEVPEEVDAHVRRCFNVDDFAKFPITVIDPDSA